MAGDITEITVGQPSTLAISDATVAIGDLTGDLLRFAWPAGTEAVRVRAHDDRGPLTAVPGGFVTAGGWDTTVRRWDTISEDALWSVQPVSGRVTAVCWAPDAAGEGVVLAAGADRASVSDSAGGPADRMDLDPSQVFAVREGDSGAAVLQSDGEINSLTGGQNWWAAVDRIGATARKPAQQKLRLIVAGAETEVPWSAGEVLAASGHLHVLAVATATQVWRYDVTAGNGTVIGEIGGDDPQMLELAIAGDAVIGLTSAGLVRFPGGDRLGPGRLQAVAVTDCGDDFLVLWPNGVVEQQTAGGSVRSSLTVRVQV